MAQGVSIRVLVADDHPLVRQGVAAVVAAQSDMSIVGEAGDGQQAVELFRKLRPDVALIDLGLPVLDGIEAMKAIRSEFPGSRLIALTVYHGDEDIHQATNVEIAQALHITRGTAKWFVSSILGKLAVDDRTEAVTTALERGILHH